MESGGSRRYIRVLRRHKDENWSNVSKTELEISSFWLAYHVKSGQICNDSIEDLTEKKIGSAGDHEDDESEDKVANPNKVNTFPWGNFVFQDFCFFLFQKFNSSDFYEKFFFESDTVKGLTELYGKWRKRQRYKGFAWS